MKAKRVVAAVVVAVLLLLVAFAVWLGQPPLAGEEQVIESVSVAKNRFSQLQREAGNPDLNAYLSPRFQEIWGSGHPPGQLTPLQETLAKWAEYTGQPHAELLEDEKYRQARADFEAILPELTESLNKRLFVVPRTNLSSFAPADSGGLRLLSRAVQSYLESKVVEKEPGRAVPALAALFSLGGKMQGRENLANDLAGLALQRTAFKTLAALPSDSALSTDDWLELGAAVSQGIPPEDQMKRAFEAEVATVLEEIEKGEQEAAASGSYLERRILEREKRIFMNQTALQLQALKSGRPDLYTNNHDGTIALVPLSEFMRAGRIMEFHRQSMIAAATVMDLRAYRSKYGKLPSSLGGLAKLGLKPQGALNYDARNKTVTASLPAEVLKGVDPDEFNLAGWSRLTETGLQLTI